MKVAVLLFLSTGLIRGQSGEVVGELKDANTLFQTRVLPRSAFNPIEVRRVALDFLSEAGSGRNTVGLSMYSDRNDAGHETGVDCEGGYRQWRAFYENFARASLVAADMISLGADAVLRARTSGGEIVRQILRGNDPTEILLDGVTFELLSLSGRRRTRFEGCGVPGTAEGVLYLRTAAALSADLCRRATLLLAARLGQKHIWTHFRNDRWFLCGKFPIQYPFAPMEPVISETGYYQVPEFTCFILCDGIAHCSGPSVGTKPKAKRPQYR